jgi:mRNA-degrading endonuclease RelE of RelBE toxin-antitoxin system
VTDVRVTRSASFERKVSKLARNHPALREDLELFARALPYTAEADSLLLRVGEVPVRVGRLRDRAAGRGQSGGFRVVYALGRRQEDPETVCRVIMLAIYERPKQAGVNRAESDRLIAEMRVELQNLIPTEK